MSQIAPSLRPSPSPEQPSLCQQPRRPQLRGSPARPGRLGAAIGLAIVGGIFTGALMGTEGRALAADVETISCGLAEENALHVDGLISDWEGESPVILKTVPAPGADEKKNTLKVRLRCNYDSKALYLLVEVDDDVVIRGAAADAFEDHLELAFAVPETAKGKQGETRLETLRIWPSAYAQKQKRVVKWDGKKPLKVIEGEGPAGRAKPLKGAPVIEVYDALQPRGYAVELRMPKKILPGYQPGTALRMSLRVVDSDGPGKAGLSATAETAPTDKAEALSEFVFEEGQVAASDLFGDLKVSPADVYFDKNADLGDGTGRVVLVGKFLTFVGKTSYYQELAPARSDVKDAQLISLDGKIQGMAVRVVERGSGGSREVLRVFRIAGGRFQPVLQAEVAKEQGGKKLATAVTFAPGKKGTEISLTPQPAVGYNAANYTEQPAEDCAPILLPWQDKKVKYVWKGSAFTKE